MSSKNNKTNLSRLRGFPTTEPEPKETPLDQAKLAKDNYRQKDGELTKRLSFFTPEAFAKALKLYCIEHDTTMSDYINAVLMEKAKEDGII